MTLPIGPWRNIGCQVLDATEVPVVYTDLHGKTHEECKEIARFIAVGPERLEACKELREVAAASFRVIAAGSGIVGLECEMESLSIGDGFGVRAQDAIRKATGEQL